MLEAPIVQPIAAGLFRYARAVDEREWALLDDVFADDATARYGDDAERVGRSAIVAGIRGYLDECGPTLHFIANVEAWVNGRGAEARCLVRAEHASSDGSRHCAALGRYRSTWRKTACGWRVTTFHMLVDARIGDLDLLAPRGAGA